MFIREVSVEFLFREGESRGEVLAEGMLIKVGVRAAETHGEGGAPKEPAEEKWRPEPGAAGLEVTCPSRTEEGSEGTGQSGKEGAEETLGWAFVPWGDWRRSRGQRSSLRGKKDRPGSSGGRQASRRQTGTARPGCSRKAVGPAGCSRASVHRARAAGRAEDGDAGGRRDSSPAALGLEADGSGPGVQGQSKARRW